METGAPLDREFCFEKDEAVKWYRFTARREGEFLITGLEDISDRKLEAEAIKENLRFRRELAGASMEVMMIMNLSKFHVRYINKDVLPEIGMTREKIQEMPLEQVLLYINPRDRGKLLEMHRKLLKTRGEKVHEVKLRVRMKDLSWAWFRVRGKVFNRRDENWVEEYLLLITDITKEKRTEKALKKARKLSIQGEVARTLAHELRNPIASIGMVKEVLDKKAEVYGLKTELEK